MGASSSSTAADLVAKTTQWELDGSQNGPRVLMSLSTPTPVPVAQDDNAEIPRAVESAIMRRYEQIESLPAEEQDAARRAIEQELRAAQRHHGNNVNDPGVYTEAEADKDKADGVHRLRVSIVFDTTRPDVGDMSTKLFYHGWLALKQRGDDDDDEAKEESKDDDDDDDWETYGVASVDIREIISRNELATKVGAHATQPNWHSDLVGAQQCRIASDGSALRIVCEAFKTEPAQDAPDTRDVRFTRRTDIK
eukprot:TRINITY_DN64086_c0_g1_i1.p2 TRINITY_DN64086_c0_g1~~TRINITY_DN64086_c0_g1_i1.p2  ORF type:complete len:273 (+),score=119.17 TRINITY_DN64086_c0_g1_i1:68-820(+)